MTLFSVHVHGDGASAYDAQEWTITVHYDGADVYTVDDLGDVDIIGAAETRDDAIRFFRDYFAAACYTISTEV